MTYRIERDSMGALQVPEKALWKAQTQRAIENFHVSHRRMPDEFIKALAMVKQAAAHSNVDLGCVDAQKAEKIIEAAQKIVEGDYLDQFPVDVYQTGSGTSTNMNMNEVLATLASTNDLMIHPNDDVNASQSSNDVIPTTIQVSACLAIHFGLLPRLTYLKEHIEAKANQLSDIVKTGRTHLMDAMPITFKQELDTWASQLNLCSTRINHSLHRLSALPQGGTAVGSGINAPIKFPAVFCSHLSRISQFSFRPADNLFVGISSQDNAVEMSGQLKTLACTLMKISNDLRWMNSGPLAGIGDIQLAALQPGSSIMPGKVNPVIPEAVTMACAKVIGLDSTMTIAGQSGNFQLNVMLPVIADSLIEQINLLANSSHLLASKAIADFSVKTENINATLSVNPILVTALNAEIGYEKGATIAKLAYQENRPIIDVALEHCDLSRSKLEELLNPLTLTKPTN